MARFLTADWHLYHRNIIEYCDRKPADVTQMHQTLVFNHNKVVTENDEVWNIGDVTVSSPEFVGKIRKMVDKFNGKKHLVLGNHDDWKAQLYEHAGFITIHTAMWFEYNGITFYMMHDPATYTVIENNKNAVLLCGHIHRLFKHLLPQKRVINVGVDAWDMCPVSFENQIIPLLQEFKIM